MSAVLDEHLSYLTLYNRTPLYRSALEQVIRPGDIVADLGCGVGVLGFMALEAGAARVYGIDHSGAIELARETAQREGFGNSFVAISGSTFTTPLPEPVDTIICDHVGYFGFDYGIVAMMADARKRLLKPGGHIVPRLIDLHIAGVECSEARKGVDGWRDERIPAHLHWLREQAVNAIVAYNVPEDAVCTDGAQVATIDFHQDTPDHIVARARLTATRAARLDGLAGYFDAELAPGVRMTNSPLDPNRIDRPNAFLPLDEPIMLAAGDTLEVTLQIRHDPVTVAWTVRHQASGTVQRMSTWKSLILGQSDLTVPKDDPLTLGRDTTATLAVLQLVDGTRTAREIEELLVATQPDLFPSLDTMRFFVRRTLARAEQ